MTEAAIAARAAGYAPVAELATRQAARLSRLAWHRLQVLLGPVVWDPEHPRRSYFIVGVPERRRWHFEQIGGEDRAQLEAFRAALIMALIQNRPIVLHDMDDELRMAHVADAILPTEQTAAICRDIAAERARLAAFRHETPEAVQ